MIAMTLGSAVVLGAATVHMGLWMTRTALVMYLAWAVPHFVVHLTMLGHLSQPTAAVLTVALGLAIALPAGLLALTRQATPDAPDATNT